MKPSRFVIAALVTALVAIAAARGTAHAQSSTAQAETLFRQGKELMAKGKLAEACAAFEASQKLDPTIATLLNQASCHEKNGQLATAWGLFLDAERQSRSGTDDTSRQLHRVAVDHAAKLEPRLSTLTITVQPDNRVGGLEILRNSDPVAPGAWNKALPVDGGTYTITARAPGNAEWTSTITVSAERDAKSLEIPKLKAAALKEPQSVASTPPQSVDAPSGSGSKVVPIVLGVAALGMFGGALGFELSARSTYDKIDADTMEPQRQDYYDSAVNKRYIAQGLGIAGLACGGVAVWLYLRSDRAETTTTTTQASRLLLQPVVTADRAGVLLQGRF